jgi:HPt (histidine-containing phosphotransfer) domain-containing protein
MNETSPASPWIYSRLGDDPDLGDLVGEFVAELPTRIAALEAEAHSNNWPQVTRFAHQLKGAAGSYGFDALTPYARDLEAAARDGAEAESVLRTLHELIEACRRIQPGVPDSGRDSSWSGTS